MASADYGPEIKASIAQRKKSPPAKKAVKESPAEEKRDAKSGIAEGSKRDVGHDAMPPQMHQAPPMAQQPPAQHVGFPMNGGGGAAPDHHRVAMASSIAHAILGRGGA